MEAGDFLEEGVVGCVKAAGYGSREGRESCERGTV